MHDLNCQPPGDERGEFAASSSAPPYLYGGHRGGNKRRKDGLCAGSPEAIAADREKDRLRKKRSRAAASEAVYYPFTPGTPDGAQTELPAFAPAATNSNGPLLALGIALVAIFAGHLAFCRKLDESIAKANPSPRKPF